MHNTANILAKLEELAERFGYAIRYENLESDENYTTAGGACRLHQEQIIIIDVKANTSERIHTLIHTLRQEDLDSIYIPPLLRELLQDI